MSSRRSLAAILLRNNGSYLGLQIFIGIMLLGAAVAELVARLHGAPRLFCKY